MTDYLDQTREAEQRLRTVISEAHGMLKDVKAERKAFAEERAAMQLLIDGIKQRVTDTIGEEIKTGLAAYEEAIRKQIDVAQARVDRRFDTLASVMLGEDKPSQETIVEHVRQWRARRGD